MIGTIAGQLDEKTPPRVLVSAMGVGYELDVPMSTFCTLPDVGQQVKLVTHLAIKEDSHSLYGFATAEERIAFRLLLTVTGIGARTALGILSGLSVGELGAAIAAQDSARLVTIPGIGAKTAERVVLDLKTKFAKALPQPVGDLLDAGVHADVLKALQTLGYVEKEAKAAIKTLPADVTVAGGIQHALKVLSRGKSGLQSAA